MIDTPSRCDVLIVGAGFAGISALYHLLQKGIDAQVVDVAPSVGGTWYHNRYPGARCDIESLDYSLSLTDELQQEWVWPERYSNRDSILAYLNHVVDSLELRPRIHLGRRVESAKFDEGQSLWDVRISNGQQVTARYLILATGVLSAAQSPVISGLENYGGTVLHTADWPEEGFDFRGPRVAVIGTGSSATQLIPSVAGDTRSLTVFQRTANYVMPAQNHPLKPEDDAAWKAQYPQRRENARSSYSGHNQAPAGSDGASLTDEERDIQLQERWDQGGVAMMRVFSDLLSNDEVNAYASEWVANKIRGIVQDPAKADILVPVNLPLGTKRLCSGTNYYETFNLDHVDIVDIRQDPITHVSEHAIHTEAGEYPIDVLIFATGFDAMTGSFLKIDVEGVNGLTLQEKWSGGPRTAWGVAVSGFPNLFILSGPQTPSVFSNMATSSEIHGEWVAACIKQLEGSGVERIEATEEAEDAWVRHVAELAAGTLYEDSRNSWFWGANTPGKPRVFMPYTGGVASYTRKINDLLENNMEGFVLS